MTPELILFYSENCFGTADTLSFRKNQLRIHDLKTGSTLASFHQLEVYAAMFCLEYGLSPFEIELIELRIYQSNEIRVLEAERDVIIHIMETIKSFDKRINQLRLEAEQ